AAGTYDLTVTTFAGTSATGAADHFVYTAAAVPVVSAITRALGSTDGSTVVTILGSRFTGHGAVTFGSRAASGFTVVSDTALTANAPPQATGTVDITVTSPSGTSTTSAADKFTYLPPPLRTQAGFVGHSLGAIDDGSAASV